jgi:hypothetical protein
VQVQTNDTYYFILMSGWANLIGLVLLWLNLLVSVFKIFLERVSKCSERIEILLIIKKESVLKNVFRHGI